MIQVVGSRRSSCRKLQIDDSVVTKTAATYLFHTTDNVRCTCNGQRSASILKQSVILDLKERWCDKATVFMEDGAPSHIARFVRQLLRYHFGDKKIISQKFPTAWPPRSLDIIPCFFQLWGYIKSMFYRDPIAALSDLEESIEHHVHNIPQFMLLSTVDHANLRFQMVHPYRACFVNFSRLFICF